MTKKIESGPQPTCFLLVGLPGSGKSTWTIQHLKDTAKTTHVASSDDVLEEIAAREGISYAEAHQHFFKEAEKEYKARILVAARAGHDLIIDRTNLRLKARSRVKAMIDCSTRFRYRYEAVVFEVEPEVLKVRLDEREQRTGKHVPWQVVEEMIEMYEEVVPTEVDHLTYKAP